MLPSTERCGGLDLTSLSPCFVCEDGPCGPPVEAGASYEAFANFLLGNFGILALRPQVRRVADKVERMRKCVVADHDALDVEEDEPFDSSGSHRLRHVPTDPGSADDVQHRAASEVDEQKPGARIPSRFPRGLKSRLPLKSGKQSSFCDTTFTKSGRPPRV